MLEHVAAADRSPAGARELARQWLDHVEHFGDLALIAREHDALGKRFGDQHGALRREHAQANRAAGRDLLVDIGSKLDNCVLFLAAFDAA